MAQERLRELLARVRERLGSGAHKLDPDSRQQLDSLMRDIPSFCKGRTLSQCNS